MKYRIFMTLISALFICYISGNAKGWRGIIPLHSTCEDVKRALKVGKCDVPISIYDLPEYRVIISFSQEKCCNNPNAWQVPLGMVTSITVSPTKEIRPSELGIDLSQYKKLPDSDIVGIELYENRAEGISVTLFNGFVQDLVFSPMLSDEKLRCKSQKRK